jgi:hypothetical protein
VNPFYQGSAGASRLTMTGKPLSGQAGIAVGKDDIDAGAFGELRQVLFIFKHGTSRGIPVADTPEEIQPIGRMLEQVWPKFCLGDVTAPRETAIYGNVTVDFTVTERYFRGRSTLPRSGGFS